MSVQVLSSEPTAVVIGTTVKWSRSLSDFTPADGWALTYGFGKSDGSSSFSVVATDDGTGLGYVAEITPAITTGKPTGQWAWQAQVEKGTEKVAVASGYLDLNPNLVTGPADSRSRNEQILDALLATAAGKATRDQSSISISMGNSSRSIGRLSWEELTRSIGYYRNLVRIERGKGNRRILVEL